VLANRGGAEFQTQVEKVQRVLRTTHGTTQINPPQKGQEYLLPSGLRCG
jgi:hypothetical protein